MRVCRDRAALDFTESSKFHDFLRAVHVARDEFQPTDGTEGGRGEQLDTSRLPETRRRYSPALHTPHYSAAPRPARVSGFPTSNTVALNTPRNTARRSSSSRTIKRASRGGRVGNESSRGGICFARLINFPRRFYCAAAPGELRNDDSKRLREINYTPRQWPGISLPSSLPLCCLVLSLFFLII